VEIGTITGLITIATTIFTILFFIIKSVWKIKETVDNSITKTEAENYLTKSEAKTLWHEIANDSVELESKYITGSECEKYRHCMLGEIDKKSSNASNLFMGTVKDLLQNSNSLMAKMSDMEKAYAQDKERRDSEKEHRKVIDNIQAAATERMNDVLEKINATLDEIKPVVYHLNEENKKKAV